MNRLVALLLGLLVFSSGCSHQKTGNVFKWPKIDPDFDSIAVLLDFKRLMMDNDISADMDSMRGAYKRSPKREALGGRMAYWEAFYQFWKCHNPDSAEVLLSEALALTDSLRMPYDYARIRFNLVMDSEADVFSGYCTVKECRKIFEHSGDSVMVALCDTELGQIMASVKAYNLSYLYMEQALESFGNMGLGYVLPRLRMNMAALLFDMGNVEEADSIIGIVLNDEYIHVNPALENLAYMNKYLISNDSIYLRKAYGIVSSRPYALRYHVSESVCLGNMFLDENNSDSAAAYIDFAYNNIDNIDYLEDKRDILLAKLRLLLLEPENKEAGTILQRYQEVLDSLDGIKARDEIVNAEIRYKIEQQRISDIRIEERAHTIIWVIILVSIIMVLSIIAGTVLFRNKILREKHEIEQRLRKNRDTMAVMRLQQETTRNVLDKFENEIDRSDNGTRQISDSVNWIRNQIKLYKAQASGWDVVLESFDEVHPDFEQKMLSVYPMLTKKQIEFAGFIALGLSSKQIAELLNIDTASVNTNRYRLRTKMGLEKSQSLEDAILMILD